MLLALGRNGTVLLHILRGYYTKIAESLQRSFGALRAIEKSNQKILANKGELSDEATGAYERARKLLDTSCGGGPLECRPQPSSMQARKLYDKLHSGCAALAEVLLEEIPACVDEEETEDVV